MSPRTVLWLAPSKQLCPAAMFTWWSLLLRVRVCVSVSECTHVYVGMLCVCLHVCEYVSVCICKCVCVCVKEQGRNVTFVCQTYCLLRGAGRPVLGRAPAGISASTGSSDLPRPWTGLSHHQRNDDNPGGFLHVTPFCPRASRARAQSWLTQTHASS